MYTFIIAVGEEPDVHRLGDLRLVRIVAPVARAAVHRAERRVLNREIAMRLDAILVVVELLVEPGMDDRRWYPSR